MATTKEFHDYVVGALKNFGNIATKKMMGEYLLYANGKLVGDICDNRLLLKETPTSKRLLSACKMEYPYKGSKTLMYVVPDLENAEFLQELLEGMAADLPEKKPKRK